MKDLFPFGEWLREEMKEQQVTQMELALRLYLSSPGQVSHYITGKQSPKVETLERIMEALGKKLLVADKDEEVETIVPCKDCAHYEAYKDECQGMCCQLNRVTHKYWYCAEGERRGAREDAGV